MSHTPTTDYSRSFGLPAVIIGYWAKQINLMLTAARHQMISTHIPTVNDLFDRRHLTLRQRSDACSEVA